jgi:hypothetical protein
MKLLIIITVTVIVTCIASIVYACLRIGAESDKGDKDDEKS